MIYPESYTCTQLDASTTECVYTNAYEFPPYLIPFGFLIFFMVVISIVAYFKPLK